jgi:hypothetical protein
MPVNRWRVAALLVSRNRVMPFGRTRIAARWKTSNRNVWTVWSKGSNVPQPLLVAGAQRPLAFTESVR